MYLLSSLASISADFELAEQLTEMAKTRDALIQKGDYAQTLIVDELAYIIVGELAERTRQINATDMGQRYSKLIKSGQIRG